MRTTRFHDRFSKCDISASRGILGNVWRHFLFVMTRGGRWEGARDAVKYLTMHSTGQALSPLGPNNYPAPNAKSLRLEKFCSTGQVHCVLWSTAVGNWKEGENTIPAPSEFIWQSP